MKWAATFGALWFLLRGGDTLLWPSSTVSMMTSDWGQHILAWLHFRQAPWGFPLGALPTLVAPVGTTLGYMDGAPLLGVLFKPFSALLPVDFQYIGLTLFACFILQGVFAYRLARHATTDPLLRTLIACVFVTAPILLKRIGHENLCAQFLLLWSLDLALDRKSERAWELVPIVALSMSLHPFFIGFAIPLGLTWIVQVGDWRFRIRATAMMLATFALVGGAFGYFTGASDIGLGGYGAYTTEPFLFVNGAGYSRLLPALPMGEYQYEGFAYLGAGVLLLLPLAIVLFARAPALPHKWLLVVVALMTLFAISPRVTVLGHELFDIAFLRRNDIARAFRASGRFVWAIHYLIVLAACALVARLPRRVAAGALVVALLVQTYDASEQKLHAEARATEPLPPLWRDTTGYSRIELVPPDLRPGFDTPWGGDAWMPWGYRAYRSGLASNSGYLSRMRLEKLRQMFERVPKEFAEAPRDDLIYVVHPNVKERPAGVFCRESEGASICVVPRDTPFAQAMGSKTP